MPGLGTQAGDELKFGLLPSADWMNGPAADPLPTRAWAGAAPRRTAMRTRASPGIPKSWPLLGREAELAYLAEAIADGRPAIVLAGMAGVGKTRLARGALDQAA